MEKEKGKKGKRKMEGRWGKDSGILIKSFEHREIRNPLIYSCLIRYPVFHTAEILEIWEANSRFYTAEKWIRGETLYDTLMGWVRIGDDGKGGLRFHLLRRWKHEIQRAVGGLHSLPGGGIIHGDISPKNIMITFENEAMLIDFNGADFDGAIQPRRWFATRAFSEENAYCQGILTEESDRTSIEKTFSFAKYILYLSQEVRK